MSKIDELYNQIIMEKINAVMEAIRTGTELDKEMHVNIVEMRKIREMLIQQSLENKKHFVYDHDTYDDYKGEPWYLAINDKNGPICFHENHGTYFSNQGIIDEFGEEFLEQVLSMEQIDIEELATRTKGINGSVDEYKQRATEAKENLIRAKLIATIEDVKAGNKQSTDNSLYKDNEIYVLLNMLEKAGLKKGVDYSYVEQPFDYNYTVPELHIRIGDNVLHFSTMNSITSIIPIEQLKRSRLQPIDLEKLGIEVSGIEATIQNEVEINLSDLAYDLDSHEVIDNEYQDIEIDNVSFASLSTVIYHAIRGELIDTHVNEQYNEYDNYYKAGEYSDMPGTEEIAIILNSIDRETLAQYFKEHPQDVALFEQIREQYPDIEELNIEIQQQKDARQLFEESLLREDVVEYYLSKTPEELEAELGPEVARMVGFEQKNSHHCYDLWEHTLRTVEGISPEGLTPEQFKKLRVAAFFHDIGKPDVSKFNEKTGQQVFYGHAMHSVDVAKTVLEQLGYSSDEIEQLSFYIGHHDDFISYKSKTAPWMKNHEFMRGIDSDTVSEKIIENQYDFKAMGYDDDQIRYICYALGHDGQEPTFATKDGPINIKVDMVEVQAKIDSGKYDAEYIPSEEDYKLLLELCKADAGAQSEVAMQQGRVVGSKKEKLENMNNIQNSIPEAFKSVIEKVTGYSFEQFIKESVPQAYGEKRPPLICKDGTEYSIQASSFHACSPKEDGLDAYDEFEVYVMSEVEDFKEFINYDGVAGNVPKEVLEEIIKSHGGLDKKVMRERVQAQKDVFKPKDEAYEKWLEEASNGNPFVAQMLRYATRRVEVRGQNEQAKNLNKQYEEQLPNDQHTVDDN